MPYQDITAALAKLCLTSTLEPLSSLVWCICWCRARCGLVIVGNYCNYGGYGGCCGYGGYGGYCGYGGCGGAGLVVALLLWAATTPSVATKPGVATWVGHPTMDCGPATTYQLMVRTFRNNID
jgi:hypothetical protein